MTNKPGRRKPPIFNVTAVEVDLSTLSEEQIARAHYAADLLIENIRKGLANE